MPDNVENLYGVGEQSGGVLQQSFHFANDGHTIPPQLTKNLGKTTIIGREEELEEIDRRLNSTNALLLISGIGGVGKSNIASYYLYSHRDQFDYYGFFEGLESFVSELKPRLGLRSEKPDELFLEALAKLGTLEGDKLLVFDDIKESKESQGIINSILALQDKGYKILFTSREEIEDVTSYNLDVLSEDDAKKLFNSIHEVKDETLLEEILEYLDYHAFFVEKTALSVKRTFTPQMIRDKFKNGEFTKISVKRKQGFDTLLNQLFSLDTLDDEEVLMLKRLTALPSIEIPFAFLETVFQREGDSAFEELLDFLSEKGWLTKLEDGYKLHQIIKEYLLANHTPDYEEIEVVVDGLSALVGNSSDVQVAVDNQENIAYFESLTSLLDRLMIEDEKVGDFYSHLGSIYHHWNVYQKAELFHLKALEIRKKIVGKEHPDTANSYNNLAGIYHSMGEYQKAELLYFVSLKIREKALGIEHLDVATSYNNLAGLYENSGDYQKAETLHLTALKIYEKVLGVEHPDIATSYNNLALLYQSVGKFQEAKPLYLKALKIRKRVLGEEHPDTAMSYNNLAFFYHSIGDYQEVESLFLKALKINKKSLGEEHNSTANIYSNLGIHYQSVNDYKKAESFHLKALEIRKKVLGEKHLDTATSYNNLAEFYRSIYEHQKVEPLLLKALEIREKLLGIEHPYTATSYNNLALFYQDVGNQQKAETLLLKALVIREKLLSVEHPDTANSYNNLAAYYYRQGEIEKAYGFMQKSVDVYSKVLPLNHPDLISSKEGLEMIEAKL